MRVFVSAIGQDSHRFINAFDGPEAQQKPLILGGVSIEGHKGLSGNSDADVILHAAANAISGLTGRPVLGARADELCRAGEKDSRAYLALALKDLDEDPRDFALYHLSMSVECLTPKLMPYREAICRSVAELLGLPEHAVCLTATTGEGLTGFGRGEGIQCLCILSASAELP